MNKGTPLIGPLFGLALLLILAFYLLKGCEKQPTTTEPTTKQQALTGKLDTHAIRAAIEAKYRQRETARFKAYSDSLSQSKVNGQKKKDKATTAVKAYRNTPSIAKADTAITALQEQVTGLEQTVALSDSVIASQNRLNASLNATVVRQEIVISEVAKIGQDALAENAKLAKKLKNRNRLLTIGGAAVAVFVGGIVAAR